MNINGMCPASADMAPIGHGGKTVDIASTKWGKRRHLSMDTLLNPAKQEVAA